VNKLLNVLRTFEEDDSTSKQQQQRYSLIW